MKLIQTSRVLNCSSDCSYRYIAELWTNVERCDCDCGCDVDVRTPKPVNLGRTYNN